LGNVLTATNVFTESASSDSETNISKLEEFEVNLSKEEIEAYKLLELVIFMMREK